MKRTCCVVVAVACLLAERVFAAPLYFGFYVFRPKTFKVNLFEWAQEVGPQACDWFLEQRLDLNQIFSLTPMADMDHAEQVDDNTVAVSNGRVRLPIFSPQPFGRYITPINYVEVSAQVGGKILFERRRIPIEALQFPLIRPNACETQYVVFDPAARAEILRAISEAGGVQNWKPNFVLSISFPELGKENVLQRIQGTYARYLLGAPANILGAEGCARAMSGAWADSVGLGVEVPEGISLSVVSIVKKDP